jgi:hypothetical protein
MNEHVIALPVQVTERLVEIVDLAGRPSGFAMRWMAEGMDNEYEVFVRPARMVRELTALEPLTVHRN